MPLIDNVVDVLQSTAVGNRTRNGRGTRIIMRPDFDRGSGGIYICFGSAFSLLRTEANLSEVKHLRNLTSFCLCFLDPISIPEIALELGNSIQVTELIDSQFIFSRLYLWDRVSDQIL